MGFYALVGRVLGITFAVKLMERGEEGAQDNYARMEGVVPDVGTVAQDEKAHETALLAMLDEERLRYTGSIVLGLNDALVELTGALAGLTLALQNTSLVAMTGAITGIAAALSMAASEYLSTKAEGTGGTRCGRPSTPASPTSSPSWPSSCRTWCCGARTSAWRPR